MDSNGQHGDLLLDVDVPHLTGSLAKRRVHVYGNAAAHVACLTSILCSLLCCNKGERHSMQVSLRQ